MDNWLIAQNTLLKPSGLDEQHLQTLLDQLLNRGIDDGDLYFQSCISESWSLEDSIIRTGSYRTMYGAGIRAIAGEKTGLAYTDDVHYESLLKAVKTAKSAALTATGKSVKTTLSQQAHAPLYPMDNPLTNFAIDEKIALLRAVDKKAHELDSRVKRVRATLAANYEVILVAGGNGILSADVRPLVRLSIEVMVEEKGRRETSFGSGGARADYRYFLEDNRGLGYVEKAVQEALTNLHAMDAPAGTMPVILGSGWSGVLLHEAVGHGLEGDFNRKGLSAYSNKIGEKVASSLVTVVDNGTLPGRRGSLNIDDEGAPSNNTVLIEKGVLKNYMQDRLNARLMKTRSTGNGRRESYAHLPMPRMTNTYMLAGEHDPEDIIRSVDKGLYVANLAGGQVDITSGQFVFSTSEAYLIEKGKITRPVKGATLIGNGPEIMQKVSMVGHDLQLDSGVGTCGKDGQSVPVGVGQPTVKIDSMVVGGTA